MERRKVLFGRLVIDELGDGGACDTHVEKLADVFPRAEPRDEVLHQQRDGGELEIERQVGLRDVEIAEDDAENDEKRRLVYEPDKPERFALWQQLEKWKGGAFEFGMRFA